MRKLLVLLFVCSLAACGNSGSTPGQKLDTLLHKADRLGDTLEVKAKESWDSTKAGARELGNKVESAFEKEKDSASADSTRK